MRPDSDASVPAAGLVIALARCYLRLETSSSYGSSFEVVTVSSESRIISPRRVKGRDASPSRVKRSRGPAPQDLARGRCSRLHLRADGRNRGRVFTSWEMFGGLGKGERLLGGGGEQTTPARGLHLLY